MTTDADERAKGVDLPAWWLERVRAIVDERKENDGESLTKLGKILADAVGREDPWDHSSLSRFLRNKNTTVPLAEAFAEVFGMPKPFYVARSLDEAFSLQQAARRYDTRHLGTGQLRRIAAFDDAAIAAEQDAKDQTAGVKSSSDEGAARSRRARRATRRRPSTS